MIGHRVERKPYCGDCGRPLEESQRHDGTWRPLLHFPNWGAFPPDWPRCRSCHNSVAADAEDRAAAEGAA
jgi:hypothetical protein